MRRSLVLVVLLFTIAAFSAEIPLPHIPTDPDQSGGLNVFIQVLNTETKRPSTNFPIKLIIKKGGYIKVITDSFGEINLLFNKEFRERWLSRIEYDDQGGKFKVDYKVVPFEPEIGKDKQGNPYSFFLYKEYYGSKLNEKEFDFTTASAFNLQYYKDSTRAYSSGLLDRYPMGYHYKLKTGNQVPRTVLKIDEKDNPAIMAWASFDLKVEFSMDLDISKAKMLVLLPYQDVETKFIQYQINVNIKTKEWDIIWLDLNEFELMADKMVKIYYLMEDEKKAEMVLGIERKVRGYLENLFTKESKPTRFIIIPEEYNKKIYYLYNPDSKKLVSLPFYKNVILKVLGMTQERMAYGIICHSMLLDIFSEIRYFWMGSPRWIFDGLFVFLEWKIHRHVFGKDYKLVEKAVKKFGKDEMIDIRDWKFTQKTEEQTYMDKGIEEMMYGTAACYFWEKIAEKYGIGMIDKFLKHLAKIEVAPRDHKDLEKMLSEVCGEDISPMMKIDYKDIKKFVGEK